MWASPGVGPKKSKITPLQLAPPKSKQMGILKIVRDRQKICQSLKKNDRRIFCVLCRSFRGPRGRGPAAVAPWSAPARRPPAPACARGGGRCPASLASTSPFGPGCVEFGIQTSLSIVLRGAPVDPLTGWGMGFGMGTKVEVERFPPRLYPQAGGNLGYKWGPKHWALQHTPNRMTMMMTPMNMLTGKDGRAPPPMPDCHGHLSRLMTRGMAAVAPPCCLPSPTPGRYRRQVGDRHPPPTPSTTQPKRSQGGGGMAIPSRKMLWEMKLDRISFEMKFIRSLGDRITTAAEL